jgi:putative ABC transport system substrate-binding protein
MGWAQSLARPGGVITGIFLQGGNLKGFEVLKEVRPQAMTFGYLLNAANPGNPYFRRGVEEARRRLGIEVRVLELKDGSQLEDAFAQMAAIGVGGIVVIPDPVFGSRSQEIAKLGLQYRMPTVCFLRNFADDGGLFAFNFNGVAQLKRAAWYVDQILKGTRPGDLPAEQAEDFKFIINLGTAKVLGLTVPPALTARADEVIE